MTVEKLEVEPEGGYETVWSQAAQEKAYQYIYGGGTWPKFSGDPGR